MIAAERIGAFLVFRDQDGLRHAVKLTAVLSVSDGDCDACSSVLQLTGNRTVVVQSSLDEVLGWLR